MNTIHIWYGMVRSGDDDDDDYMHELLYMYKCCEQKNKKTRN